MSPAGARNRLDGMDTFETFGTTHLVMLALFVAGAVASYVIAQIEDAAVTWPSAWLLVRAMGAGWLILAAIIVIYIVLGVLYESVIHPITILSTLPSAGIGARHCETCGPLSHGSSPAT